jgi:hypothetical protein
MIIDDQYTQWSSRPRNATGALRGRRPHFPAHLHRSFTGCRYM